MNHYIVEFVLFLSLKTDCSRFEIWTELLNRIEHKKITAFIFDYFLLYNNNNIKSISKKKRRNEKKNGVFKGIFYEFKISLL